jgi:Myb-like DNA-binding domain
VKKGRWTTAEDKTLTQVMSVEMFKNWPTVALSMGGRTAKQCRERWFCHLSPHVNKDAFTAAEDAAIMSLHARVGNKWARIAACLPGRRSETSVKSRIKTLRSMSQHRQRRHSAPAGSLRALVHESLGATSATAGTTGPLLAPAHTVPPVPFDWPTAPDPVPLWEQLGSCDGAAAALQPFEAAQETTGHEVGLDSGGAAAAVQQEEPGYALNWTAICCTSAPEVDLGAFHRECCVEELVQCLLHASEEA